MSVALVFPPFAGSAIHGPHLAVPLLRAVLAGEGIASVSFDLNLRAIECIRTSEFIQKLIRLVDAQYPKDISFPYIASLSRLEKLPPERFLTRQSGAFKFLMKVARQTTFPVPQTLSKCLDGGVLRPTLAGNLYDRFVDELLSVDVDCYGFSVAFGEQLYESIELARRLREKKPVARLILGGSQINLLDQEQISRLAASDIFHAISIGNGEQTIVDLVRSNAEKKVVRSGAMHREEMDRLPQPLFEADLERYIPPLKLPVLVTKGCYWGKCTFCDYPRLADLGGKRYISRSPEIVLSEIKALQQRYNPEQINLISDAVPPSWYAELATRAIDEHVQLKSSSYMMHSKSLDEEFFALLSRAGVRTIRFGTESTNERILDVMKKQAKREVIINNFRLAYRYNIRTVANVIPDYPTTTFAEAVAVLKDFQQLSSIISSINPQMFDLTAGAPAAADPDQFKLIIQSNAYVKSSHGYHGITFARGDGLTSSQRNFLMKSFNVLERQKTIERKIARFADLDVSADTMILFDGAAALYGNPPSRLMLASLDHSWALADFEVAVLRRVFGDYGYLISFGELRSLFEEATRAQDFDGWFRRLIRLGLIDDLQTAVGNSAFRSNRSAAVGAVVFADTRSDASPEDAPN